MRSFKTEYHAIRIIIPFIWKKNLPRLRFPTFIAVIISKNYIFQIFEIDSFNKITLLFEFIIKDVNYKQELFRVILLNESISNMWKM